MEVVGGVPKNDVLHLAPGTLVTEADIHSRHRPILDALNAAIYITDTSGRITYFNEAAVQLWGHRPEHNTTGLDGFWQLFWPDGSPLPFVESPMALALKQGQPVRGIEFIGERPDGTRVPVLPFPTPLFSGEGTIVGAVNMLVDLSDRRQMEQRLISIVESSDDAIISKDLDGIIRSWNKGAERIFGYTSEEVIGKSITILIPEDRDNEEPEIIERIKRGERIDHYETVRRRSDGSLLDISLTISPMTDVRGRIIGASKIARDISDRKRAEEQQTLLLREAMHRVKNTLATVQALATQSLRNVPEKDREVFLARLQTLAAAHDLLNNGDWDRAPLHAVVDRALSAFDTTRFRVSGPEVWLTASNSLTLTLALHEMATNAAKYGALSNGTGTISLDWKMLELDDGSRVNMFWCETGGPPASPPSSKGFGSRLIEYTLKEVEAEYGPEGFRCSWQTDL